MDEFNIHNVRFYEFSPEAIHCISYNNDSKLLALSRADGSIEIWDCQLKPFKLRTLIGQKGSSVESLIWCKNRLFSAGLNGFIIEYDSKSFVPKNQISVTGGPTWCLALSPNQQILAAGTEEGYVCLFDVEEEQLLYRKTLKRQKSRILSIGWHFNNEHLVTGSVNYAQLLSIETELGVQFPVAKLKPNKDTIIWCVAVLDDKTIVTGDSRGKTSFWDGNFGTLISALQTHQADVLTMQVAPDCQIVYVAGVDPVITEVRLVDSGSKIGKKKMWVKSTQRRIHTHDVRSLALTQEGKLFSGGVDTYLALSYYPPRTAIKYPATPPKGYISCGRKCNRVMLGYKNRIELWALGRGRPDSERSSKFLAVEEDRIKLAEIELKSGATLECCSLSPQGSSIAYVAKGKLKIYSFTAPSKMKTGSLQRVPCDDEDVLPSSQILWLDEEGLVSATYSSVLQVLSVRKGEVSLKRTFHLPSGNIAREITSSEDGDYVAAVDAANQVVVFSVRSKDSAPVTMPKNVTPVTSFAISDQEEIFITYSNMSVTAYNIHTSFCTTLGKTLLNNPSPDILKSNNVIQNISFYGPNHIFLHSVSSFFGVHRSKSGKSPDDLGKSSKISKCEFNADTESNDSCSPVKISPCGKITTVSRSNHVLHFSHMNKLEMISIEINPVWLLDRLPPALKVKKFGAA